MNKQRRHFADHEKVAILKRHLIDKVPVSDLCDELGLYPNQGIAWYWACVVGDGRPLVTVVDHDIPPPRRPSPRPCKSVAEVGDPRGGNHDFLGRVCPWLADEAVEREQHRTKCEELE